MNGQLLTASHPVRFSNQGADPVAHHREDWFQALPELKQAMYDAIVIERARLMMELDKMADQLAVLSADGVNRSLLAREW